jgi:hypothetical protein
VQDNARSQRTATTLARAKELGLTLWFLPSDAPNRNLIERLGRFLPRRALDGRYQPTFAEMEAVNNAIRDGLLTP